MAGVGRIRAPKQSGHVAGQHQAWAPCWTSDAVFSVHAGGVGSDAAFVYKTIME